MQIRFASDKLEEGQLIGDGVFQRALPSATSAASAVSQASLLVSRLEILDMTSTATSNNASNTCKQKLQGKGRIANSLGQCAENKKIYTRLGSFSHRDSPSDPLLTRSGIKGSGLYRPSEVTCDNGFIQLRRGGDTRCRIRQGNYVAADERHFS